MLAGLGAAGRNRAVTAAFDGVDAAAAPDAMMVAEGRVVVVAKLRSLAVGGSMAVMLAAGRLAAWGWSSFQGVMVSGDIELEVGAGSTLGQYVVRVVRAVAGGEPEGVLHLDVDELLSRRDLLEKTVLASAVARRFVSAEEEPVRKVGQQLFDALFSGPVYGTYRASMGMAQQSGTRL